MKKMFLLFAMTLIIANNLSAEEFVVEGVRYSITYSSDEQKTVKVMGCTNIPADSSVVIPASVEYNDNEFAVTSIGTDAFYCIWLKTSHFPKDCSRLRTTHSDALIWRSLSFQTVSSTWAVLFAQIAKN